ncbi:hypothetical protein [Pedobacter sp. GR22-10]|uniref:hypothetical protein n=1 Tax=Pedobacter sp. GR22-10 TaxID=2994472 RepID=UPI002247A690|nr:hypothetical protein [Pedobacter sp. GR22-10]MCX2429256.1 hypothetical protein [Pedobacter sp. GR22-10]
METLEAALKYTEKKKKFQLRDNDIKLQDRKNALIEYINNQKDDSSVGLNFERLSNQYIWQFINNYVNTKNVDHDVLLLSTYYAIEANNWEYSLGMIAPTYDFAILFNYSTMHLGQLLYLGWIDQSKAYGNFLIKMLYSKHYTGGNAWAKHPWLIITLFCKWQNIVLDKSKLHYPEDMGVYQDAIDNWDTADTNLLDNLINQLCDFHIKNSDEDVSMDEFGGENGPEFSSSDYFIFPVEILTWLAIRKQLGLPAYTPKHELMRLEINQLSDTIIPFEENELVLKCKAKLANDNPGLTFELDIIPPAKGNNNWSLLE